LRLLQVPVAVDAWKDADSVLRWITRYGYNVHNTRDLAISLLNTVSGVNPQVVNFWAGHGVDRLGYNQFWTVNPSYVEEQYRLAEQYLNLTSNWQPESIKSVAKENEELRERLTKLEGQFVTIPKDRYTSER
jgi:hypothetical protein